jgi:hypothetical protein
LCGVFQGHFFPEDSLQVNLLERVYYDEEKSFRSKGPINDYGKLVKQGADLRLKTQ